MVKSQQWASDDGVGVKNRREAWHCREGRSVKKDADGEDFLFIPQTLISRPLFLWLFLIWLPARSLASLNFWAGKIPSGNC